MSTVNTTGLRALADDPAANGYVPVHPDTLRAVADLIDQMRLTLIDSRISRDDLEMERDRLRDALTDFYMVAVTGPARFPDAVVNAAKSALGRLSD